MEEHHSGRQGAYAPVWVRDQRPRRPALTREAIVEAAVEIADTEGLEAVSMRRVAAHLGARTMSLYTHIDRKEDLLDLMYDRLVEEILVDDDIFTGDWRAAISEIARKERASLLRHPWFRELVGRRSRIGPNALRHVEQSLAALDPLNLDPAKAAQVVGAIDHFMLGYVMMEILHPQRGKSAVELDYIRELAATGDYPRLTPLLDADWPHGGRHNFELGLKWLLDGIEQDLRQGRS
jgi:AcrR family transcriptional regulator